MPFFRASYSINFERKKERKKEERKYIYLAKPRENIQSQHLTKRKQTYRIFVRKLTD